MVCLRLPRWHAQQTSPASERCLSGMAHGAAAGDPPAPPCSPRRSAKRSRLQACRYVGWSIILSLREGQQAEGGGSLTAKPRQAAERPFEPRCRCRTARQAPRPLYRPKRQAWGGRLQRRDVLQATWRRWAACALARTGGVLGPNEGTCKCGTIAPSLMRVCVHLKVNAPVPSSWCRSKAATSSRASSTSCESGEKASCNRQRAKGQASRSKRLCVLGAFSCVRRLWRANWQSRLLPPTTQHRAGRGSLPRGRRKEGGGTARLHAAYLRGVDDLLASKAEPSALQRL